MWTLQTAFNHNSYKSNETVGIFLKTIFPDSQIDDRFQYGKKKTAYFSVCGIAEYLKSLIINDIRNFFNILFDESLKKKYKAKQMDFHVRFWKEDNLVTHCLGSFYGTWCL